MDNPCNLAKLHLGNVFQAAKDGRLRETTIAFNGFRPPEPRSGWAKARMRRSQEGDVTSGANSFMYDERVMRRYSVAKQSLDQEIPLGAVH